MAKAAKGDCGVPTNYDMKDITIDMLAETWLAEHYPGKYVAVKYDDDDVQQGGANDQ